MQHQDAQRGEQGGSGTKSERCGGIVDEDNRNHSRCHRNQDWSKATRPHGGYNNPNEGTTGKTNGSGLTSILVMSLGMQISTVGTGKKAYTMATLRMIAIVRRTCLESIIIPGAIMVSIDNPINVVGKACREIAGADKTADTPANSVGSGLIDVAPCDISPVSTADPPHKKSAVSDNCNNNQIDTAKRDTASVSAVATKVKGTDTDAFMTPEILMSIDLVNEELFSSDITDLPVTKNEFVMDSSVMVGAAIGDIAVNHIVGIK